MHVQSVGILTLPRNLPKICMYLFLWILRLKSGQMPLIKLQSTVCNKDAIFSVKCEIDF